MKKLITKLFLSAILLTGCSKDNDTQTQTKKNVLSAKPSILVTQRSQVVNNSSLENSRWALTNVTDKDGVAIVNSITSCQLNASEPQRENIRFRPISTNLEQTWLNARRLYNQNTSNIICSGTLFFMTSTFGSNGIITLNDTNDSLHYRKYYATISPDGKVLKLTLLEIKTVVLNSNPIIYSTSIFTMDNAYNYFYEKQDS